MRVARKVVGFVLLVVFCTLCVKAQWPSFPTSEVPKTPDGKPNLEGPTPRTPDGKPDLSGIWEFRGRAGGGRGVGGTFTVAGNRGANTNAPTPPPPPPPPPDQPGAPPQATFFNIGAGFKDGLPYTPWAAELHKQREATHAMDNPDAHCLPLGLTQLHMHPQPRKIIQTPKLIVILYEAQGGVRQIFMDGRKHPEDPDPTWYGHSVGRWEGNTLVIDTVGFNDKFWFDFRGHPHTEKLHTIERWTRKDMGTLVNEVTIDDPGAYSRPFKLNFTARLRPGEELMEYICQENNQDVHHIQGPAGVP